MKQLLGVALFVALIGCGSTKTSGLWVDRGNLHVDDPAFAANIEVVQDVRHKTDEGFLQVQITVKNTNRGDFRCQYCFEWRDGEGMIQHHAQTPWRPMVLHGYEIKELEGVSTVEGSEDFRLKIRRAD